MVGGVIGGMIGGMTGGVIGGVIGMIVDAVGSWYLIPHPHHCLVSSF